MNTSNIIIAAISEVICLCIYRIKLGVSFREAWLFQARRSRIPRPFRICRSYRSVWIPRRAILWKKKGKRVWGISYFGNASLCWLYTGSTRFPRTSRLSLLPTRRLFFALVFVVEVSFSKKSYRSKKNQREANIIYLPPTGFQRITYYPYEKPFVRTFAVCFRSSLHIVHVMDISIRFPKRRCEFCYQMA